MTAAARASGLCAERRISVLWGSERNAFLPSSPSPPLSPRPRPHFAVPRVPPHARAQRRSAEQQDRRAHQGPRSRLRLSLQARSQPAAPCAADTAPSNPAPPSLQRGTTLPPPLARFLPIVSPSRSSRPAPNPTAYRLPCPQPPSPFCTSTALSSAACAVLTLEIALELPQGACPVHPGRPGCAGGPAGGLRRLHLAQGVSLCTRRRISGRIRRIQSSKAEPS